MGVYFMCIRISILLFYRLFIFIYVSQFTAVPRTHIIMVRHTRIDCDTRDQKMTLLTDCTRMSQKVCVFVGKHS